MAYDAKNLVLRNILIKKTLEWLIYHFIGYYDQLNELVWNNYVHIAPTS